MKLPELIEEERLHLAWLLHQERTVEEAMQYFYDHFKDAKRYTLNAVRHYKRSADYKKDIADYRKRVRDSVDEKPYTHRAERLSTLVRMLKMVLRRVIASERVGAKKEAKLSFRDLLAGTGEVRALIKEIGEQYLPYEKVDDQMVSPHLRAVSELRSLDPEILQLIRDGSRDKGGNSETKAVPN